MADQQQTNAVRQTGTGRQGEEAKGEQTTVNAVQLEMLKALKEARERQEMMMTMMLEMQRKQEEMGNFCQQLMQIPTFKAMFLGGSKGERAGVEDNNNNKENQIVPLATESQPIPVINLEPQNSGDVPQPRLEVSQPHPNIILTTLPTFSQVQPIQALHDASVHQPISLPNAPPIYQYISTPQGVHTTSKYVTKDDMIDVIDQLRKQTSRPSELDFTPPYPAHVRRQPYPTGYIEHPPHFPKYNGEKGNAREHIARFVESMSPWLGYDEMSNHNLLMREFNKTLTDSAFSWYYNLEKGSIQDWDDLKLLFFKKFFYVQKQVTIVELMRFEQKPNEELSNYVDRFRAHAQKCVEPIEEKILVNICSSGASDVFKPHLIVRACNSFATLSSFAQDLRGIVTLPEIHATDT